MDLSDEGSERLVCAISLCVSLGVRNARPIVVKAVGRLGCERKACTTVIARLALRADLFPDMPAMAR